MPSRHRSMHSRRLHTNIADFIYRCVKENTEGQTRDVFAAQECDAERHGMHALAQHSSLYTVHLAIQ